MPSATFTHLPPERREHVEEIVDFHLRHRCRRQDLRRALDRLSVHGRGGVTLAQYWYGEGPLAFHALLHQWRLTGMDDVLVDATQ
jgi:hypothetical protein